MLYVSESVRNSPGDGRILSPSPSSHSSYSTDSQHTASFSYGSSSSACCAALLSPASSSSSSSSPFFSSSCSSSSTSLMFLSSGLPSIRPLPLLHSRCLNDPPPRSPPPRFTPAPLVSLFLFAVPPTFPGCEDHPVINSCHSNGQHSSQNPLLRKTHHDTSKEVSSRLDPGQPASTKGQQLSSTDQQASQAKLDEVISCNSSGFHANEDGVGGVPEQKQAALFFGMGDGDTGTTTKQQTRIGGTVESTSYSPDSDQSILPQLPAAATTAGAASAPTGEEYVFEEDDADSTSKTSSSSSSAILCPTDTPCKLLLEEDEDLGKTCEEVKPSHPETQSCSIFDGARCCEHTSGLCAVPSDSLHHHSSSSSAAPYAQSHDTEGDPAAEPSLPCAAQPSTFKTGLLLSSTRDPDDVLERSRGLHLTQKISTETEKKILESGGATLVVPSVISEASRHDTSSDLQHLRQQQNDCCQQEKEACSLFREACSQKNEERSEESTLRLEQQLSIPCVEKQQQKHHGEPTPEDEDQEAGPVVYTRFGYIRRRRVVTQLLAGDNCTCAYTKKRRRVRRHVISSQADQGFRASILAGFKRMRQTTRRREKKHKGKASPCYWRPSSSPRVHSSSSSSSSASVRGQSHDLTAVSPSVRTRRRTDSVDIESSVYLSNRLLSLTVAAQRQLLLLLLLRRQRARWFLLPFHLSSAHAALHKAAEVALCLTELLSRQRSDAVRSFRATSLAHAVGSSSRSGCNRDGSSNSSSSSSSNSSSMSFLGREEEDMVDVHESSSGVKGRSRSWRKQSWIGRTRSCFRGTASHSRKVSVLDSRGTGDGMFLSFRSSSSRRKQTRRSCVYRNIHAHESDSQERKRGEQRERQQQHQGCCCSIAEQVEVVPERRPQQQQRKKRQQQQQQMKRKQQRRKVLLNKEDGCQSLAQTCCRCSLLHLHHAARNRVTWKSSSLSSAAAAAKKKKAVSFEKGRHLRRSANVSLKRICRRWDVHPPGIQTQQVVEATTGSQSQQVVGAFDLCRHTRCHPCVVAPTSVIGGNDIKKFMHFARESTRCLSLPFSSTSSLPASRRLLLPLSLAPCCSTGARQLDAVEVDASYVTAPGAQKPPLEEQHQQQQEQHQQEQKQEQEQQRMAEALQEETFLRALPLCVPYLSLDSRIGGVAAASKKCMEVVWSVPIVFANFSSVPAAANSRGAALATQQWQQQRQKQLQDKQQQLQQQQQRALGCQAAGGGGRCIFEQHQQQKPSLQSQQCVFEQQQQQHAQQPHVHMLQATAKSSAASSQAHTSSSPSSAVYASDGRATETSGPSANTAAAGAATGDSDLLPLQAFDSSAVVATNTSMKTCHTAGVVLQCDHNRAGGRSYAAVAAAAAEPSQENSSSNDCLQETPNSSAAISNFTSSAGLTTQRSHTRIHFSNAQCSSLSAAACPFDASASSAPAGAFAVPSSLWITSISSISSRAAAEESSPAAALLSTALQSPAAAASVSSASALRACTLSCAAAAASTSAATSEDSISSFPASVSSATASRGSPLLERDAAAATRETTGQQQQQQRCSPAAAAVAGAVESSNRTGHGRAKRLLHGDHMTAAAAARHSVDTSLSPLQGRTSGPPEEAGAAAVSVSSAAAAAASESYMSSSLVVRGATKSQCVRQKGEVEEQQEPLLLHELDEEQILMLPVFARRMAPLLHRVQSLTCAAACVPLISCIGPALRRLQLQKVLPAQLYLLHAWICTASRRCSFLSSLKIQSDASCMRLPYILSPPLPSQIVSSCFCCNCFWSGRRAAAATADGAAAAGGPLREVVAAHYHRTVEPDDSSSTTNSSAASISTAAAAGSSAAASDRGGEQSSTTAAAAAARATGSRTATLAAAAAATVADVSSPSLMQSSDSRSSSVQQSCKSPSRSATTCVSTAASAAAAVPSSSSSLKPSQRVLASLQRLALEDISSPSILQLLAEYALPVLRRLEITTRPGLLAADLVTFFHQFHAKLSLRDEEDGCCCCWWDNEKDTTECLCVPFASRLVSKQQQGLEPQQQEHHQRQQEGPQQKQQQEQERQRPAGVLRESQHWKQDLTKAETRSVQPTTAANSTEKDGGDRAGDIPSATTLTTRTAAARTAAARQAARTAAAAAARRATTGGTVPHGGCGCVALRRQFAAAVAQVSTWASAYAAQTSEQWSCSSSSSRTNSNRWWCSSCNTSNSCEGCYCCLLEEDMKNQKKLRSVRRIAAAACALRELRLHYVNNLCWKPLLTALSCCCSLRLLDLSCAGGATFGLRTPFFHPTVAFLSLPIHDDISWLLLLPNVRVLRLILKSPLQRASDAKKLLRRLPDVLSGLSARAPQLLLVYIHLTFAPDNYDDIPDTSSMCCLPNQPAATSLGNPYCLPTTASDALACPSADTEEVCLHPSSRHHTRDTTTTAATTPTVAAPAAAAVDYSRPSTAIQHPLPFLAAADNTTAALAAAAAGSPSPCNTLLRLKPEPAEDMCSPTLHSSTAAARSGTCIPSFSSASDDTSSSFAACYSLSAATVASCSPAAAATAASSVVVEDSFHSCAGACNADVSATACLSSSIASSSCRASAVACSPCHAVLPHGGSSSSSAPPSLTACSNKHEANASSPSTTSCSFGFTACTTASYTSPLATADVVAVTHSVTEEKLTEEASTACSSNNPLPQWACEIRRKKSSSNTGASAQVEVKNLFENCACEESLSSDACNRTRSLITANDTHAAVSESLFPRSSIDSVAVVTGDCNADTESCSSMDSSKSSNKGLSHACTSISHSPRMSSAAACCSCALNNTYTSWNACVPSVMPCNSSSSNRSSSSACCSVSNHNVGSSSTTSEASCRGLTARIDPRAGSVSSDSRVDSASSDAWSRQSPVSCATFSHACSNACSLQRPGVAGKYHCHQSVDEAAADDWQLLVEGRRLRAQLCSLESAWRAAAKAGDTSFTRPARAAAADDDDDDVLGRRRPVVVACKSTSSDSKEHVTTATKKVTLYKILVCFSREGVEPFLSDGRLPFQSRSKVSAAGAVAAAADRDTAAERKNNALEEWVVGNTASSAEKVKVVDYYCNEEETLEEEIYTTAHNRGGRSDKKNRAAIVDEEVKEHPGIGRTEWDLMKKCIADLPPPSSIATTGDAHEEEAVTLLRGWKTSSHAYAAWRIL